MYGIPNMKLDKRIVQRRIQLMVDEGVRFVTGTEVGEGPARHAARRATTTPPCSAPAPRWPATCRSRGGSSQGIHLAMEFLTANTKSLLDSQLEDGTFISREGQGRGGHRRRRHRHRLRGHRHPARGEERGAAGDHAPPARRAGRRQPVAAVAQGVQARLRAGGGEGALGRRPPGLRRADEALPGRRRGARLGPGARAHRLAAGGGRQAARPARGGGDEAGAGGGPGPARAGLPRPRADHRPRAGAQDRRAQQRRRPTPRR